MKVLLLANDSTYVYNLRREVIEAMLAKGWQVAAACDRKQHAEELEQMGCRLLPLEVARHGKNPLQDLALLRSYGRLLDAERPDVVLTYNIKPNVYGGMACAKRGIPYLVNVCGLGTPVENPGPMQVLTVALYKRGVKKAACVFFQNQENEDFFNARRMAPGHHHLLPGSGVNTARFALLPYPKGETVDFLFISRVMKEKGIDQYLEAARVIHARHPETVFHILGGCDDESYRKTLAEMEATGAIRYHGQQPSVLPFQEISACTVQPRGHEQRAAGKRRLRPPHHHHRPQRLPRDRGGRRQRLCLPPEGQRRPHCPDREIPGPALGAAPGDGPGRPPQGGTGI